MAKTKSELLRLNGDLASQIEAVRNGITAEQVREYTDAKNLSLSEALEALGISTSTFFSKKEAGQLNTVLSEKFLRLVHIVELSERLLKSDSARWLRTPMPALNNRAPISLLDTEPGARLVEQTLLQIQGGVYG